MQNGQHLVNQVVACGLKEAFRADPQVTVTWLSYMVAFNELRTTIIPRVNLTNLHLGLMLSDGTTFAVHYLFPPFNEIDSLEILRTGFLYLFCIMEVQVYIYYLVNLR